MKALPFQNNVCHSARTVFSRYRWVQKTRIDKMTRTVVRLFVSRFFLFFFLSPFVLSSLAWVAFDYNGFRPSYLHNIVAVRLAVTERKKRKELYKKECWSTDLHRWWQAAATSVWIHHNNAANDTRASQKTKRATNIHIVRMLTIEKPAVLSLTPLHCRAIDLSLSITGKHSLVYGNLGGVCK